MKTIQMLVRAILILPFAGSAYSTCPPAGKSRISASELGGVYTIQQVQSNRFVDAYTDNKNDFELVTRDEQEDKTQKWVIKPTGEFKTYTIQHLPNNRYVDAYENNKSLKDYRLVTRMQQHDGSQDWILTRLDENENVYKIQQKKTRRYVDAYTNSKDNRLVTRSRQEDNSQNWLVNIDTTDMKFMCLEYKIEDAQTSKAEPYLIDEKTFCNGSSVTQSDTFKYVGSLTKTSEWQWSYGFTITNEMSFTAGVPGLSAGGAMSISASMDHSWGESSTESEAIELNRTLVVPPYSALRARATSIKTSLDVPYVMYFQSDEANVVHESHGIWSGTTFSNTVVNVEELPGGLEHIECDITY